MELPLYVWRPERRFERRQRRPLGERLHDWLVRIAQGGRLAGSASHGAH